MICFKNLQISTNVRTHVRYTLGIKFIMVTIKKVLSFRDNHISKTEEKEVTSQKQIIIYQIKCHKFIN